MVGSDPKDAWKSRWRYSAQRPINEAGRTAQFRHELRALVQGAVTVLLIAASAPADDFSHQNRIRIAWRGSSAVAWHGTISIMDGSIIACSPLGTDPQVAGSIVMGAEGVQLNPLRPSHYHALDLTTEGTPNALLRLQLRDSARPDFQFDQSIAVDQVLRQGVQLEIDTDTTMLARAAPGDELRVQLQKDQLIFAPREVWQLDVAPAPHLVGPDGGRLTAELLEREARRSLWRTRTTVAGDRDPTANTVQRLTIPIPDREGVYDLALAWTNEPRSNPFGSKTPLAERRIQFVVVDSQLPLQRPPAPTDDWPIVFRLNAGQSEGWKRTTSLTRWNRAGSELDLLLRSNETSQRSPDPDRFHPGEHRAEVISIRNPAQPHLLELTFSGEPDAGFMVAILEADEHGQLDWHNPAGTFVMPPFATDLRGGTQVYRMLFWPRTRRPVVYLSNPHRRGWVQFESLKVLEGPKALPTAAGSTRPPDRRQVLAWISDPHLLNTFSPPEWRDPVSGRGLTEWLTFLTTARRLTDYLHYQGYTGASMNVWSDGGAIFPSGSLQGSSRWDNGAYFTTGQDPVPKDVLELYLRVFDREGLTCIPGFCFNSRLPVLEQALFESNVNSDGIDLIHRDGRNWRNEVSQRDGRGSFYNPLDPRVQKAMIDVVLDLARRYSHHPSFTGVQVELSHDSYANLPSASWGYDRRTMSAFWGATHSGKSQPDQTELAALLQESGSPLAEQWRQWRCKQLTAFYQRMLAELQSIRPDLQLHLATGKLAQSPAVVRACVPALPRRQSALSPLLDMGIDPRQLSDVQGLVVARPWIHDVAETLVGQGPWIEWNRDSEIDTAFSQRAAVACDRVQLVPFQLPDSANGNARWLIAPADRLGVDQREPLARALVNRDANVLLLGGAQPTLGELNATRPFLSVFAKLPNERFEQPESVASSPVVLRTCVTDAGTYFYAVNRAPWTVNCRVQLRAPAGTRLAAISANVPAPEAIADTNGLNWEFPLAGHGLEAAWIPHPEVPVLGIEVDHPPEVEVALHSLRSEVIGRMPRLQSLEPVSSLANPGFERLSSKSDVILGWEMCREPGVQIGLDSQRYFSGASSLRLQSAGADCWIRSDRIEPPRTGRLSLHLQLRRDPACRAPLRLSVEGTVNDRSFHRFAEITSLESPTDPGGWTPIVLQVTDLPDKHVHDLHVRFDLLGPGEIWIDDVQLYDLSFTPKELNELSMIVSVADLQLSDGELAKCYSTLRRYWPRYLLNLVPPPPPRVASQVGNEVEPSAPVDATGTNGSFPIPKLPWR